MNSDARASLWLVLGFLALHLAFGSVTPLIGDESYYALWSTVPDWSYYDHPPMIAWMIHVGGWAFGNSPLGIRLVPLLAMAGASLAVADMAPPGLRARAVMYFNLGLLGMGVGGFATPDAPSTFFWLLSTAAALRATERQRTYWWILAGLAAGIGIMSKFTNLFLGVGYVGWLLSTSQGRASLRGSGPWLALIAAALPVVPLIQWNLEHNGLGYERQFGRIIQGTLTAGHVVEYLALLVLLPGPMIALLGLRFVPRAKSLLLWSVAPLLAYFAVHALHAPIQGNWIMPVTGVVAVWAAQTPSSWHRWAAASTAALSIILLAVAFNPWIPLGTVDNPPNQTRGWPDFLAQIPPEGWIATTDYALTGQLHIGLPGRPIWSVDDLQRYGFRGPFPRDLCSAPGWLIEKSNVSKDYATSLFTTLGPEQRLSRTLAGSTVQSYRLRAVEGVRVTALCGKLQP